ncbi:MAG: hypothetical protein ACR2MB_13480 [Acidimicrobiales bacterium]
MPVAAAAVVAVSSGFVVRAVVAVLVAALFLKIGAGMLGGFARPIPAPPEPGELRKVRLVYRCTICATEVRMTMANDQVPEPPRHCMEDMDLVTPVEDL